MSLEERRREFRDHVWNHSVDPFQLKFDERRPLNESELQGLGEVANATLTGLDDAKTTQELGKLFRARPELLTIALQLVGLTRNKILQDLKGARTAETKYVVPSSYQRLPHTAAWNDAGPYLVKRLEQVLRPLVADLDTDSINRAMEALNQATWPGFIRQERAKRSGHEAEGRVALLLLSARMNFEPEEKADNPLCRDAQIDGLSFDIVVPNVRSPKLLFKATVHTSNIGQYGESKDHLEVDEARRWIDGKYGTSERPILVALIDGVGFESNRAGLDGVLEKADEFCQFRTIWKILVLASTALERKLTILLPKSELVYFQDFLTKHRKWTTAEVYSPEALAQYPATEVVNAGDAVAIAHQSS